jgi:predicted DNA-binding antitoxin AbrB/MazE fold protein
MAIGVQQLIPALYEDGGFKPLEPVYSVPESIEVDIAFWLQLCDNTPYL